MTQADNNATIKPQATSQNSALVSIIIPAYNTAQYIHRAIGSSLRQTHKNIEIIIVDDGSTDDTLRVAEYFAETDSRIRVFTQKNAGVSAARNHGIDKAKGEYIYFLDSDDWLEDDAIETLLDAQSEHPDCLICRNYHDVKIDDSVFQSVNISKMTHSCFVSLKDIVETFCGFSEPNVFHNASSKLFRTPFSARFPEGVIYGEDAVFFMRYFIQSGKKAWYESKPVLNVLSRKGSFTRSEYKPEMFTSLAEACGIVSNLIDEEDCEYLKPLYVNNFIRFPLTGALKNGDRKEIRRIRSYINPQAWLTIKYRKYTVWWKLKFFLTVFAPVPVFKAFFSMWNILKLLHGKKKPDMEIITNWQDFPKAPEI